MPWVESEDAVRVVRPLRRLCLHVAFSASHVSVLLGPSEKRLAVPKLFFRTLDRSFLDGHSGSHDFIWKHSKPPGKIITAPVTVPLVVRKAI